MTDTFNDAAQPPSPASPGALIKAAREKSGIHLAILSVNLKVSVKQLEALEADQFDKLLEPVFARALAAKVCRMIKLDPNEVLPLMPVATNGLKPLHLIDTDGQASFSGHSTNHHRQPVWGRLKFWALLVFCVVVLLALNIEWAATVWSLNSPPQAVEIPPVMPPVQEPVAPEPAQNELPKAMVFDAPSAASPATASNPTETVPTEVKK